MELPNDFKDKSPDWASGCEACTFGIVAAPEIIGILPLYEQRAVACGEEMILFCDCRAGFMYRQYLCKVAKTIGIFTYKNILEHLRAASVPSVHLEPTP